MEPVVIKSFTGHKGRPGQHGGSAPRGAAITPKQQSLLDGLKQVTAWHKYAKEGIVLEHGKFYEAQPCPKEYKPGAVPKLCFMNAYKLAQKYPELTYVEGYASLGFIDLPFEHAWCVDKAGKVIDPTWQDPETSVYFGIEFDDDFITKVQLDTETYGVIDFRSDTFTEKYSPETFRRKYGIT